MGYFSEAYSEFHRTQSVEGIKYATSKGSYHLKETYYGNDDYSYSIFRWDGVGMAEVSLRSDFLKQEKIDLGNCTLQDFIKVVERIEKEEEEAILEVKTQDETFNNLKNLIDCVYAGTSAHVEFHQRSSSFVLKFGFNRRDWEYLKLSHSNQAWQQLKDILLKQKVVTGFVVVNKYGKKVLQKKRGSDIQVQEIIDFLAGFGQFEIR